MFLTTFFFFFFLFFIAGLPISVTGLGTPNFGRFAAAVGV